MGNSFERTQIDVATLSDQSAAKLGNQVSHMMDAIDQPPTLLELRRRFDLAWRLFEISARDT